MRWLSLFLLLLAGPALAQSNPEFSTLKLKGSSSGVATITPPAAAGTPTITLPTTSGTMALTGATALTLGNSTISGGTTTRVLYDNAGLLGEYTNTQLTALLNSFTTSLPGAAPASGGGTTNFLRADATWAAPAATTPGGSSGQVQFNNSGAFGGLTNTQLTADINAFTSSLSGAAPSSGGGTANFLRADGTWAVPAGSGIGTVTTTGSPASGNLTKFSGATSIVNGDLSGDVTTSGTLVTTLAAGSASNLNSGTLPAGRMPAHTGDVTSSAGSVVLTLAAGSAGALNSGTLGAGRLPALTGDVTSSAGSAATTLAAGSASNLNSGVLAAARGGAGTISGALKGNGSGVVSQAACADLSNGATGCSTATGTSGGNIPLLNGTNVWSGQQSALPTTLSSATSTVTPDGTSNNYVVTLTHANTPFTLANPSATPVAGTGGQIVVIQSATGSDVIGTWGSQYEAPGGTSTLVLSTGVSAVDVLSYYVRDATHIELSLLKAFSH